MSEEEGSTSLGVSEGDISSTDLSDVEDRTATKEISPDSPSPETGKPPPLLRGYSQTYIVREQDPERDRGRNRQVLFRCGNWCYTGEVSFAGLGDGQEITLKDIPRAVPILQRQQDRLKFFCCAGRVPLDSIYREPVEILAGAQDFVARELASSRMAHELTKWSRAFHWIDDDSSTSTYFELQVDLPPCMEGIAFVACKTYARGLVFIMIYHEGYFYVVMQDGEGDQALLDIKFPDVSRHGQGLHLMSYKDKHLPWRKLTLWHTIKPSSTSEVTETAGGVSGNLRSAPKRQTTNLASTMYVQTYVIMKPTGTAAFGTNGAYRDVLFRFGSWCYSGTVQLTPSLTLGDVPHVIPALRMQQSKLDFMCDVSQIPSKSPFAAPLAHMQRMTMLIENEVAASEEVLTDLLEKLSGMGLEDSVSSWFGGDSLQSFFEFQTAPSAETKETLRGVDLVATKSYSASGVVTIAFWFEDVYYVVLGEGGGEQPLLDSRFPNVSSKGRGYQVRAMSEGLEEWKELRKVSVWQTAAALQQEIETKMTKAGEKKKSRARALSSEEDEGEDEGDANESEGDKNILSRLGLSKVPMGHTIEVAAFQERAGTGGVPINVTRRDSTLGGQAEPKDAGEFDSSTNGVSAGAEGTNRMDGDRTERSTWNKDVKQLAEVQHSEVTGSKHDANAHSPPATSGGGKDESSIDHYAAAKALTNTKVALPHHLTPMTGLEDKINKMRMDMQNESGDAPWDAFGRPRTSALGAKNRKQEGKGNEDSDKPRDPRYYGCFQGHIILVIGRGG